MGASWWETVRSQFRWRLTRVGRWLLIYKDKVGRMNHHWGRRLSTPLFHFPHPPINRIEISSNEVRFINQLRQTVEALSRAEVDRVEVRYRWFPYEARSVLAFLRNDGEECFYGPVRVKATALDLVAAGWPVSWRFRTALVRRWLIQRNSSHGDKPVLMTPWRSPLLDGWRRCRADSTTTARMDCIEGSQV